MIRSCELSLPPAQTSFRIQHFSLMETAEHTFFASFNTPLSNSGDAPGSTVVLEDTGINEAFLRLRGFPCSSAGKEFTCNAGDPSSTPRLGRSPGEGIDYPLQYSWASLVAQRINNLPAMRETGFDPWVGKFPWRRAWQPSPVFLPGESPWTEEPSGL